MKATAIWLAILAVGFGVMVACRWGLPAPWRPASRAATAPAATGRAASARVASAFAAASAPAKAGRRVAPVGPRRFFLFLGGLSLMMLGGSALLMRLYGRLVTRRKAWAFDAPLVVMYRYRRLLGWLHVAFFGAVIAFAAVAYAAPDVQGELVRDVHNSIHSGEGPLGMAGEAYLSRNIAYAAAVTLGVNFVLGSLLSITVPSMIIPAAGLLVAGIRAVVWGLVVSPTFPELMRPMVPHSFTLLLEGEAYILAGFFAVMVPVYLWRKGQGGFARRYGKAAVLNVKGNVVVLIVLAVAAIYEAIEVIAMLP